MWNEPSELELRALPAIGTNEEVDWKEVLIRMHFFLGGCDWYVAEYAPADRIFYGYAILNDDLDNAEWGYMSLDEMRDIRTRQGFEIDRDLHWQERKASEIEKIVAAYRGQSSDRIKPKA